MPVMVLQRLQRMADTSGHQRQFKQAFGVFGFLAMFRNVSKQKLSNRAESGDVRCVRGFERVGSHQYTCGVPRVTELKPAMVRMGQMIGCVRK